MGNIKIIITLSILIGIIHCAVLINQHKFHSGKIHIFSDKHGVHCGSLLCVAGCRCVITQKNHANDTLHLITREKCLDDDDKMLKHNKIIETLPKDMGVINRRYEVNANGVQVIDAEKAKEIAKNLAKSFQEIQKSVMKALNFGNEWPFGNKNNPFARPGYPFYNQPNYF